MESLVGWRSGCCHWLRRFVLGLDAIPQMSRLNINTPLPDNLQPGEVLPWADPALMDLLNRKVNALWNLQGAPGSGIQVHHGDESVIIELL